MPTRRVASMLLLAAALAGCAVPREPVPAPPASPAPPPASTVAPAAGRPAAVARYHCDHDIVFTVKFSDDAALIESGARGTEKLLRDAGGTTPWETVYSSTAMKAEFGLGTDGRQAVLHFAQPAFEAHCEREPA